MLTRLPSPAGCHDRAVLLYEYVGKRTVDLQHTEVPDAYRGRGIAKHLAKVGPLAGLSLFLGQSADGSHPAASLQLGVGEGCGEGAARGVAVGRVVCVAVGWLGSGWLWGSGGGEGGCGAAGGEGGCGVAGRGGCRVGGGGRSVG